MTFDLWQTLLMDTRELGLARMQVRLRGARDALTGAGEEYSEDRVREAYRECYRSCHGIRAEGRDVSFAEQIEIFIGHIDPALPARLDPGVVQSISDSYADSLFDYPPPPHEDASRVLEAIRTAGYRMGLISNTGMTPGVTFRAYMERLGLLEYFEVHTFSDEVRLAKPAREIFRGTLEAMGAAAGETVHVGDHLLNDVYGAKQAGMKTVWIETHDDRRTPVDVEPDATVPSLGCVSDAVARLAASG